MNKFKLGISTSAVVEIKLINVFKNICIRIWHTGHPQYTLISFHNPLAPPFLYPPSLWRGTPSIKKGEMMLLNCGIEKTLESPLDSKEIKPVNPKGNQSWIFIGRTDAEAEAPILWPPDAKELTPWKRPWCWERLQVGEGDDREWDGWMPSLSRWTWVWASPGSC